MDFYFSKGAGLRFRFPVTPRAVTVSVPGRDRAAALADGTESLPLNGPGLREISFEALLPNRNYHFAVYPDGVFRLAAYYLELIEKLKAEREPFIFTWGGPQKKSGRADEKGQALLSGESSLKVSLDSFTVTQDASYGGDVVVSLRLREAREARLSVIRPENPAPPAPPRDLPAPAPAATYTVVRGDTLWGIAKRFLGSGSRWPEIYELNRDKVSNPNLIYVGQVLILP